MFKNLKYLTFLHFGIVTIFSLTFTGCMALRYNISPEFDKKSSVLYIGKYKVSNASIIKENSKLKQLGSTTVNEKIGLYYGDKCENIKYLRYKIVQDNIFYTERADEIIKNRYNNCNTEKINNLYFIDCGYNSFITSSDMKGNGYDNLEIYELTKDCFDNIKEFYKNLKDKKIKTNSNNSNIDKINFFKTRVMKIYSPYYINFPLYDNKYDIYLNLDISNEAIKLVNNSKAINQFVNMINSLNIYHDTSSKKIGKDTVEMREMEMIESQKLNFHIIQTWKVNLKTRKVYDIKIINFQTKLNKKQYNTQKQYIKEKVKNIFDILDNGVKTGTTISSFKIPLLSKNKIIKLKVSGLSKIGDKNLLVAKYNDTIKLDNFTFIVSMIGLYNPQTLQTYQASGEANMIVSHNGNIINLGKIKIKVKKE